MSKICYGLEGKVAVVTGGSRGIGLEIAKHLLSENAKVAICGRKQENIDSAVSSLGKNDNLLAIQGHIGKEPDVDIIFSEVLKKYSRIDILINNVGMNLMTPSTAETDLPLFKKIIDTNLSGTFMCSSKAASIMKSQKEGKIISISSIAGRKASPGMGIYGIAKAGIEMLTKVLSSELALFNIQVNAVAPAMVRTEFSMPFWSNKEIHDHVVKNIPLGRIAEPIDVVHPTLFLASSASDYITGQTLVVDGGSTSI